MINFLGIGAQKSGTTWLYEMLCRHENILMPGGKEIHFWDAYRARGIQWYKSIFEGEEDGKVKGEITPAYATLSQNVIREIYDLNPELRIIYILRNPIERAWSSSLMALKRAEMTIDEASDQWFIDHFMSKGSLERGDYEGCIRRWRSIFPSQQLFVLLFEDIISNPRQLLSECSRHLGVDNTIHMLIDEKDINKVVFPGSGYKIRNSLYPVLTKIYKTRIASLSEYLQKDFSSWIPK